ncbi:methylated-DNA--[protein]-cysteine S-methyltransferase [Reichenbachiella versicolor]|uniref:methylated-DNA--[protein]-cysteine S-methyltransferase n=1 Tax=Reichenbachiella versicolor TaxID=1821036 RepID=UPI000D6EAE36|nr:methylated-DNA--[protein]-cysteine S-methyltransferase [Reichenbachiella versicolor]
MNDQIHICTYHSPVGELIIGIYDNQVCLCDWKYRNMRASVDQRIGSSLKAHYIENLHPLAEVVMNQLNEYFNKSRKVFELPLLMVGTEFQRSVWDMLISIPYGQTHSYLQLSQRLGDPKAIRAVASANGANALSIIVPCHRIIGSNGDLTGYAGGLSAKQKLLEMEGAILPNMQVELFEM